MTEQTTNETAENLSGDPTEKGLQDSQAPAEQDAGSSASVTDDKPGREAAKYRRQLRDTEAERDTLKATVEQLQRRMVQDVAGKQISRPEALWAAGVDLADLLDGDGLPDAEKIRTACADASDRLGLSRPTSGNYVPNEGKNTRHSGKVRTGFADAFRPGS